MRLMCSSLLLLAGLGGHAARANSLDDWASFAHPGVLTIAFYAVESLGTADDGYDSGCRESYRLYNRTKYHLDNATLQWGKSKEPVGEMVANTKMDGTYVFFSNGGGRCSQEAAWLQQHASEALALDCSMRGLAEGDCQEMVRGVSLISDDQVALMRVAEDRRVAAVAAAHLRERTESKNAFPGSER